MHEKLSKRSAGLLAALGIGIVGLIDYVTGTEIRIFPLYFIPLLVSASHFGSVGSLFFSLLAAIAWVVAMYIGGSEYSHNYVWGLNILTQFGAFLFVSLMYSRLTESLEKEKLLSRTDTLTGLLNSRAFYENAHTLLKLCHRHKRALTLAYIDLDNFKNANDSMGHLHGDLLLTKVGGVLMASLRSSDLIARLGGDEFAVLLPEMSPPSVLTVLETVRSRIEAAPELMSCGVTASIGAVSFVESPADFEQLIKRADELMYKAKKAGKNHVALDYF